MKEPTIIIDYKEAFFIKYILPYVIMFVLFYFALKWITREK